MRSSLRSALCFTALILSLLSSEAFASTSGVTYQGRILKPDGSPLSGQFTQFKMQIRTPDSGSCLMYEEVQLQDLRNTGGVFSLTINDGSGSRTDATGLTLDRIFANRGSFALSASSCNAGPGTYAPGPNDGRDLVVLFKDETMATWEPIPAQKINFVPFAFEAKQVAGFTADSLLRVVDGSGDPITGLAPLSNAQYTALLDLVNGSSAAYTKAGQLNGKALPTMTSGEVLGWNGTTWVSQAATSGPNSITTTMIQNGAVSGTKLDPAISISTSGTIASAITTTRDFKIYNATNQYVEMVANNAITGTTDVDGHVFYKLTWPAGAASTNGQVLTSDTSGNLTWTTPSSAGITTLTGDVTATGPGSAAATVASVGTSTAAQVHSAEVLANAATAANTADTIVKRDGTGGFAAGAVSATSVSSSGAISATGAINGASVTATGAVTGASVKTSSLQLDNGVSLIELVNPSLSAAYTLTLPSGTGTTGQILTTNGLGVTSWTTPLSNATAFVQGGNTFGANADLGTNDGFDLNLRTGGTTKLTVTSGGLVGIGTTSPSSALTVAGSITPDTNGTRSLGGSSHGYSQIYGNYLSSTSGSTLTLNGGAYQFQIANSTKMVLTNGSKVGIGTTVPVTKLEVTGSLRVGDGGETCDGSLTGAIRYNGGNLQFCAGVMPWTTLGVSGAGLTALTGDVTASGTGSVAATVASVGGSTAAQVHQSQLDTAAAASVNTPSTIVKRDASGGFAAGAISGASATFTGSVTQGSSVYKDTGSNTVTVQAPPNVTSSYILKWPVSAGGSDDVLKTDASGNLSWSALPTALPPTGSAGGDLTGTYPNPTLAANAVTTSKINDKSVTYAKIQDVTTGKLLGRSTAGPGSAEEISVGSGLSLSGGTLSSTNVSSQWTAHGSDISYDGGGRVGIGTSAPEGFFHAVDKNSANNWTAWAVFESTNSSASGGGLLIRNRSATDGQRSSIEFQGTDWHPTPRMTSSINSYQTGTSVTGLSGGMYFETVNNNTAVEAMRILPNQNVGIGTSSPSAKLDVKGAIVMSGATSGHTGFQPAAVAGTTIWTLPSADGTSGQVLSTDGAGILSWSSPGGGGDFKSDGSVTMTGVFKAANGTAAAPSVTFGSNTNTGMYRANSNRIGFSTGGSSRMVIDNTGVGIGTTNPGAPLDVNGLVNAGQGLLVGGYGALENTDNTLKINFTAGAFNVGIYPGSVGPAAIWVRNPTGEVGIGTTSPNGRLDVKGSIVMSGSTSGYTGFQPAAAAGSTVWTLPSVDGASGQVLRTNGSGTLSWVSVTDTLAGLSCSGGQVPSWSGSAWVCASTSVSSSNNTLVLRDGSGNVAANVVTANGLSLSNGASSTITLTTPAAFTSYSLQLPSTFGTNGQVLTSDGAGNASWVAPGGASQWTTHGSNISYDGGGNVGIGTTNPVTALDVTGGDISIARFTVSEDDDSPYQPLDLRRTRSSAASPNAGFGVGLNFSLEGFTNDTVVPAGRINTQWEVNQTDNTAARDSSMTFMTTADGAMTEKMRITSDGKVGIGTANPAYGLDVRTSPNSTAAFFARDLSSKGVAVGSNGAGGFVQSAFSGGGATQLLVNPSGGNVMLGGAGTALSKLGVTGSQSIGNSYSDKAAPTDGLIVEGNVGIGTTSPTGVLDIHTSGNGSNGFVNIKNTNAGTMAAATLNMANDNGSATLKIQSTSSGNTGSPYGASLSVIDAASGGLWLSSSSTGSTSLFRVSTGGAGPAYERLRVDQNGNVGIGTTNPGTKLQVAGVISPSADNTHDLGTAALRFKDIYAANNVIQTSDARLKTDVKESDLGLDFINNLRPVSYYWKEGDPKLHYGVIAQETEKALSDAKKLSGRENEVDNVIVTHDEKTDRYGVRYTELIAPIIKAIQELYSEVFGVKGDVDILKAQNASQDRAIASVKAGADAKAAKLEAENKALKARADKAEKENAAIKAYLCAKDKNAAICK